MWHRNEEKQISSQEYQAHCAPNPKDKQGMSPAESPILLRREIPMAWGTTTDSLTLEIDPFQYAIEFKCLTLKDQTSYLIPDGLSRSQLRFKNLAWIDKLLSQQQVNNTSILYFMVLDLF